VSDLVQYELRAQFDDESRAIVHASVDRLLRRQREAYRLAQENAKRTGRRERARTVDEVVPAGELGP
jgi:hypothetical protein